MAAKQIAFDQEAREAMKKGIGKLAKAVKVTLEDIKKLGLPANHNHSELDNGAMGKKNNMTPAQAAKMMALVEKIATQGVTREQLRKEQEKPKPGPGRPKAFVFSFRPPTKAFNLRLTFAKKNASKDEVITALEAILQDLRNAD